LRFVYELDFSSFLVLAMPGFRPAWLSFGSLGHNNYENSDIIDDWADEPLLLMPVSERADQLYFIHKQIRNKFRALSQWRELD
jgi:hypothetical protein